MTKPIISSHVYISVNNLWWSVFRVFLPWIQKDNSFAKFWAFECLSKSTADEQLTSHSEQHPKMTEMTTSLFGVKIKLLSCKPINMFW